MPPLSTISKSTVKTYIGSISDHDTPFSTCYNQNSYTENLMEIIVNGAASLYEKMVKDFTNQTMTDAAAGSSAKLLPCIRYSDEQNDHTQALLAYRHITQTSVYDQ
jgi:hypothetical protein